MDALKKKQTVIQLCLSCYQTRKIGLTVYPTFHHILQAVREWKPRKVNIEFEAAEVSALKEVFPSAEINEFYQNVVRDLELTCEYRQNENVRLHIRMCLALTFLNPDDVLDGWLEIHS